MDTAFPSSWEISSNTIALGASPSGFQNSDVLTQALGEAQHRLQQLFNSPTALEQLNRIFDVTDLGAAQALIANGILELSMFPEIQVLAAGAMNGARGAYSTERNTIYLADSLLAGDPLTGDLSGVLLEEIGHYMDTLLNPGGDTPSDEGELLRHVVLGHDLDHADWLRIQSEDDRGSITVDGQNILVEQDNSLGSARNIGTLGGSRTFTNFVGTTDPNDYYRFNITSTSKFRLALDGLSADADVQLLDGSGQIIQSSTAAGSSSESIDRQLSTGTYYVRVYPYSGDTNYRLALSATALTLADGAGNRLSSARNIGSLSNSRSFRDFVGSRDTNDYYRFNLTQTSNFSLTLNGLFEDADVQLLNRRGAVIQSSAAGETSPESINRRLRAGTYYVRVYPYRDANTSYRLALAATPVPTTSDGAGNTLGAARNLGRLSGSQSFQDFVGSSDTNDYYRFTLGQSSNFRLTLNGLSADGDVELLNRSGGVIQSSTAPSTNAERMSRQLTAGTYYVRVYPYSGSTNYSLSLTARAVDQADGAGNTLGAARNISTLSGSRSFQDFVGTIDTNDYYRFNLTQTSNFRLGLTGLGADADVQLLNSSGAVIQGSYGEGSLSESIIRTLNAGTYYVRVYPYSGSTNYSLALSATATDLTDGAGNTLGDARNLGTLTGRRSFNDAVGSSDTNDYYRFDLTQTRNFSLALDDLSADADVQLLDSNGQVLQSSALSGTRSEQISRALSAGTYYVRVYPYSSANTNYKLTLSTAATTASFNATYGYGLVNAAAAVARALGQTNPFPDVANLGGNNWGNDMVNAPEAWARGYTGQGIVAAVVDTGVDYNHRDLRDNIWVNTREIPGNGIDDDRNGFIDDVRGWDFIGRDNNPMDEDSHGTHVAGTIAAGNNGFGMTGVAYNARIMPVRVLGPNGGANSTVANGIRYAVDNGANVINLSLGGDFPSAEIESALRYATQQGVFVVMAAGNDGDARPDFPARYATQNGLSIGAVNSSRQIAGFSNRAGSDSTMQHVVAPGVDIYSTTPGNTYRRLSGTSMATPHVAGVVALMLSANRNLTHAQIRQILTSSAVALA